ncbi:HAD family phosphatase [Candidatus Babeliales bacterium]|nr:HAD family phosphatase [Candidatus Babeliales bacterium]
MKYEGIIFDMDGTIVQTEHIWEDAIKQMLKKKDPSIPDTTIHIILDATCGSGLEPCCHVIKDQLKRPESVQSLVRELVDIANVLYEQQISFVEGFVDFHQTITQKYKLKSGIATNASDETVEVTNKKLKLDTFFGKHIYNISRVNNACKPDPAVYLYTAKQLRLTPKHCIAIEDSAAGVGAAKAAGMFCIGMNSANKPEQVKYADFVVTSYYEIDLKRLLKK